MGCNDDCDCTLIGLVADVVMMFGDKVDPGLGEMFTCTDVAVELGMTTA